MKSRILLIGKGLFRDGLTHILSDQPNTEIVAAVSTWQEAEEVINSEPNTIIVDHEEQDLLASDLSLLFESEIQSIKIIYLTLSNNRMIIHNRQQLSNASITDLIHALQFSGREDNSGQ